MAVQNECGRRATKEWTRTSPPGSPCRPWHCRSRPNRATSRFRTGCRSWRTSPLAPGRTFATDRWTGLVAALGPGRPQAVSGGECDELEGRGENRNIHDRREPVLAVLKRRLKSSWSASVQGQRARSTGTEGWRPLPLLFCCFGAINLIHKSPAKQCTVERRRRRRRAGPSCFSAAARDRI